MSVIGTGVLAVGVVMIVLPGPAILVIPLGFAILGTEFPWASRLLERLKARVLRLKQLALAKVATVPRGAGAAE